MLARLTVPYADVSAGDLCWALAGSGLAPLASVEVPLGSAAVRLSVLGASHEVVATIGGESCTEVIACGVGAGGPLPSSATRVLAGLRYRMTSTVLRLDAGDLARRAGELRARLAGDDRALVAAFPGHDVAITALEARGDGRRLGWRTWHAYPRTGELVVTATRLWAP
jgi:hypothetical protein